MPHELRKRAGAMVPRKLSCRTLIGLVALAMLVWTQAAETIRVPIKKDGAGPLFQIHRGEKWGYIDRTGRTAISAQFDDEGDFFQGLAKARKGWWGYIDEKGRQTVPFRFENAGDFQEGLAPVKAYRGWGFIDRSGKFVIEPRFGAAAEFHEACARVEVWDVDSRKTRYGFVNKHGDVTLPPGLAVDGDFSGGLAPASVGHASERKLGYIDRTGKIVIEPRFLQAYSFSEGLAAVLVGPSSKAGKDTPGGWGFIDRHGRFVVPPTFAEARSFKEGLAAVLLPAGDWGYIDKRGGLGIAAEYNQAEAFSGGLALVASDQEEDPYYIDSKGRKALLPGPVALWPFSDGLTIIEHEGEMQYIDRSGKVIAPYQTK